MAMPKLHLDFSSLPKTRAEAISLGSTYYYPGKPCKKGHIEAHYTTSRGCRECQREKSQIYNNLPEKKHIFRRGYKKYYSSPHGNKAVKANSLKRRADKKMAVPPWADLKEMAEFIAACPDGYDVDHIVPLKGKRVRGFHILENLQYLPASENRRKSNKVDPLALKANICVLPQYRTYVHS